MTWYLCLSHAVYVYLHKYISATACLIIISQSLSAWIVSAILFWQHELVCIVFFSVYTDFLTDGHSFCLLCLLLTLMTINTHFFCFSIILLYFSAFIFKVVCVCVCVLVYGFVIVYKSSCNTNARSPAPIKIGLIGGDAYINSVLRPYVEHFSAKTPDWQSYIKFLLIPFGENYSLLLFWIPDKFLHFNYI